jgi:hypothetical protein
MGRKINTKHKNFLANLQAAMKKRNRTNNVPTEYTEQDMMYARLANIEESTPATPITPTARITRHARKLPARNSATAAALNTFEAEYQAFIAKLKANKAEQTNEETKVEEVKEEVTNVPEPVIEEQALVEETPVVEDVPKKIRKKKTVAEILSENRTVEEKDPFDEF